MNENQNYSPSYIDNLIKYLHNPDIINPKDTNTLGYIGLSLKNIGAKFFNQLNRTKNTVFNDGVWYNEAKARQLVIDYLNNPDCKKALSSQHHKIIEIYDRLAHLSHQNGTWADGIDRELLTDEEAVNANTHHEEDFHELDQMVLENVLLPETAEEQIFMSPSTSYKTEPSDPKGQTYIFKSIENGEPPTSEQLFHIHADEFGKSSALEGSQSRHAVNYLHSYLQGKNQSSGLSLVPLNQDNQELIDELQNALSVDDVQALPFESSINKTKQFVEKAKTKISMAFVTKTPLLVMGGWTGNPAGHAIYYEIIPDSNNRATLRLYNTGAGTEHHHRAQVGDKVKYQAYTEWNGIDRERLESPYFLEALYELNTYRELPESSTKSNYGHEDVYQGLKALLQPRDEATIHVKAVNDQLMMTQQRSGVCSWRSLMAWLRTKIPLNDYMRFKADIKLQSLADFVKGHSEEVNPRDWRLVRKSHQKLCRGIVHLYQKGLVGDEYIKSAQAVLKPISEWIRLHADCRFKRTMPPITFTYAKPVSVEVIANRNALERPLFEMSQSLQATRVALQPYSTTMESFQQLNTSVAISIQENLGKALDLANQAWQQREDVTLHKGLIDFVSELSLDSAFWQTAIQGDPKKAEQMITQLGELSSLFRKSCFTVPEAHINFSEKVYLFHKILFLQEQICHLGHPKTDWQNVLLMDYYEMLSTQEKMLCFTDAKMHREMALMQKFYGDRENGKTGHLIKISEHPKDHEFTLGLVLTYKKDKDRQGSKATFENFIRKEYPDVLATIAHENSNFSTMPLSLQDAHIYASPFLPEWVKAMRDAQLDCLHLERSYVGELASLDRTSDLQRRFVIQDTTEFTWVIMNLNGVSNDLLAIPEIDKIKQKPAFRYAGQYREIVDKTVQEMIVFLKNYDKFHEKQLFHSSAKRFGVNLPDEEFRELAHLFIGSKLQQVEVLEYFTRHPEKIKNPDYQTLLQILLFKTGELDNSLKIPGFVNQLVLFLQRNYDYYKEENEIQATVFLLKLAHHLDRFCPGQEFFHSATGKLESLLERKGIEPDAKCLIYAELLAQIGRQKTLSENQVALLLEGAIFLEENQTHSKYKSDPSADRDIREALVTHAKEIQTFLVEGNPNQHLLNHLLSRLRPESGGPKEWTVETKPNEFPQFVTTDGTQLFYPILSKLISSKASTLLPIAIRRNPLFRQLFPTVELGTYQLGNSFAFKDHNQRDTLVYMNGDNIVIEQKLDEGNDRWYRYVPAESFLQTTQEGLNSQLGSRYLVHHYVHWQSLENRADNQFEIYAINLKTGKRDYALHGHSISGADNRVKELEDYQKKIEQFKASHIAKYGHLIEGLFEAELNHFKLTHPPKTIPNDIHSFLIFDEISRIQDQARLGKTSTLFTSFEDPAYIHEWYEESGQLKGIDLPRFHLSFKTDPTAPGKLKSDQFPGYVLNSTDPVSELGVHHHFILLENEQGQRKVLLPLQQVRPPKKMEVLLPSYELNRGMLRENREDQKYLTFDLHKNKTNGKLFSKNREANFYLAQVLVTAQEYKKAAHYLKKFGPKLSGYTSSEAEILEHTSQTETITGDKSGNGVALQLYASYLLAKNRISHHQELSKEMMETLRTNYDLYLNHYINVTVFHLEPQEEILLLKTLLAEEVNPSHLMRLKELDPIAAQTLPAPKPRNPIPEKPIESFESFVVPLPGASYRSSERPEEHVLLTRMGSVLIERFEYYYRLALSGTTEEKQRLREALHFVRDSEGGKHRNAALLFGALLDDPAAFPQPYVYKNYGDQEIWRNQVKEAALKQLAKPPVSKTTPSAAADSLTTGDYRLEGLLEPTAQQSRFSKASSQTSSLSLTPLTVTSTLKLPSLTAFATDCLETSCFQITESEEKSDQGLSLVLQTAERATPLQAKEMNRLIKDLKAYQSQPAPTIYTADDQTLRKATQLLARDKLEDKENLLQLEKALLELANKKPQSEFDRAHSQLKQWGGLRQVITLEELIVNFAHQDSQALLQRNPALDATDALQIKEMVGSYLLYVVRDQQRTRAEAILTKIEEAAINGGADSQEYKDRVNQLAHEMMAQRAYDPVERPAYLVFEYFANISMRQTQVEKLDKFLKGENQNLVMEMIMGSGKSKVLLPLLGMMRANGKNISMLIVPQPLFESIAQDTQTILQESFSQPLRSLHFDRNTRFTRESLETILDELESIQENRECLIMTSKSVQCLMLKFIAECAHHFKGANKDKGLSEELKIMQKILSTLIKSGFPIIDEADTVLNVLHEVSFSGGSPLSPKTHELDLLSGIYHLLYENDAIKSLARLESDPTAHPEAPQLTEALYRERVQQPLAEAFIDHLGQMTFDTKPLTDKVHSYIRGLSSANRANLLHYLCRNKEQSSQAQQYFDTLDQEIQDLIAFAGEQIAHLLPYTLAQLCDEKYGVDEKEEGILAIPFAAAKTPNSGSQFSNAHITMNYTYQNYMKKGVKPEMVEGQIKLLQEKVMREIAGSGGKLAPLETVAGKAFAKLRGSFDIPLFNYKPSQLQELVERINGSPEEKRNFVSTIILPQMVNYANKLSCNPQNLVALFNKLFGFTGTLWNGLSMHPKLKPEPEIGTDAKTLSILWENSRGNAISISEGSPQQMLTQLHEQGIAYDMISDAGGYFKEGSNREVAHQIAAMQGKEVVFYNAKGEQTLSVGTGEIPLIQSTKKPEERITFLDQSHTTGADVPQKWDATSLVTIGRNMLLRDLLQSVWRLRGLDKSQRVRFLVSEEVAAIIRQTLKMEANEPIQFEAILRFTIANQAAQQGRDNYKALKQEFANLSQMILFEVLLNDKLEPMARLQAFRYLQSNWIKPAALSSRELYGKLAIDVPSEKVLEIDKKACEAKIKELFVKMPWLSQVGITERDCLDQMEDIYDRMVGNVPLTLPVPSREIDDDQTVEVETETETDTETDTELNVQSHNMPEESDVAILKGKGMQEYASFEAVKKALSSTFLLRHNSTVSSTPFGKFIQDDILSKWPVFPLKSYLLTDSRLSDYQSAFDGIDITFNVLDWKKKIDSYQFLGEGRIPIHHLLIKGSKVVILSLEEGPFFSESPDYYNLTLGYADPKKKPSLEVMLKVVKLKFLNGEAQYSVDELKLLKQWFKAAGASKMRTLYLEHILSGYPQKVQRYQHSTLQHLFAEMTKASPKTMV